MNLIDQQLSAYNARDLEGFIATYAPDAVIEDGRGNILARGHEALRERFGAIFQANPDLHCRILHRIQIGKFTVDEEEISGIQERAEPLRQVVIYRVEGNQIVHARTLR